MTPGAVSTALLLTCTALTTGMAGCGKPSSHAVAGKERYNVAIRWTAHGVPHVRAQDWGSLGYGFAYAVATDAVCTLAREFINVRGEQSRFFGPEAGRREADITEQVLAADPELRTLELQGS